MCSYDRAGLGASDPDPAPRTALRARADLERLLERAALAPPYVLVGHSAGGMYHRVYAAAHPERVAGLVLIDSDEPDERERAIPARRGKHALAAAVSYSGLRRLLLHGLGREGFIHRFHELPEETQGRYRGALARQSLAMNGEWDLYRDAWRRVPGGALGDVPLVVISALADKAGYEEVWLERQRRIAALSTRARHVVLRDGYHYVQLWRPEVVVEAVREVVEAARARG